MKKDYSAMTYQQLWDEIEKRFGNKPEAVFNDKEKISQAFEMDDGLLKEYLSRISRGR